MTTDYRISLSYLLRPFFPFAADFFFADFFAAFFADFAVAADFFTFFAAAFRDAFLGAAFFAAFLAARFLAGFAGAEAVAAAGGAAAEWTANIAPWRSRPWAIQSPPGTSIGPLITFAPAFPMAAAVFLASGTLIYASHAGGPGI